MGNRYGTCFLFLFILAEGGVPKYDIACVGAGMAGLAAAALLTKAGRAVCLMDPADSAGGCVAANEIGGFRFIAGPTITYGFEPGGILQKLFSDLDLSANTASSSPGYQVVMPEHRITVSGDPRETLEELVREFPNEIQGLTRLYREVHKFSERISKSRLSSYFLRQRTAAAYLQSYRFGRSLIAYFDVQSRFFFGSSLQRMPLATLVLMLTSAPHYLPGGFTRLADQLLSIVQQQNGTWYHGEPIPELLLHANRITGIRTSRGIIEPRTVLLNVPDERAESILFLGIRDEVIPVGMLPSVLCLAEDASVGDYYTLSLSPADDLMAAPMGMRSLTAAFSPAKAFDQPVDSSLSSITPIVPFLQDFLVTSSTQDPHARRFPLPPGATVKPSEYRVGRPMLTPCSVKNLKIVPDSVRALLPAVFTAQTVAEKLK